MHELHCVPAGENYGGVGDCWAVSFGTPQHPQAVAALQHIQRLALQEQQQQQLQEEDASLALHCCVRRISKKIVQDVTWSPTRDEFVLIEGKSPSGETAAYAWRCVFAVWAGCTAHASW